MSAFLYSLGLQWRTDLRNKEVAVTYYLVPLVFFLFMGGIFSSVMPDAHATLIQSMTVFGVTMGALLGSPSALVETCRSDIKKAHQVGNIPLWSAVAVNFLSAFVHLSLMSLVIYFAAPLFFGAQFPRDPGGYFLTLSLFTAASLSVGSVLGLFVKSASKLTMASQLIFLPSIMLSGIMLPSGLLPDFLQYAGKAVPATWGYRMMLGGPSLRLALPLLLLTGLCLGLCSWKLRRLRRD